MANINVIGRLPLKNGVGRVGLTIYEQDGVTLAVARTTAGIVELTSGSGWYMANPSISGAARLLRAYFDDGGAPARITEARLTANVDPIATVEKVDELHDNRLTEERAGYLDLIPGIDGSSRTSPTFVDDDHTWWFQTPADLTASNVIYELIGFYGLICMDFTDPIPKNTVIDRVVSVSFQPSGLINIIEFLPSPDRLRANITIDAGLSGTAIPAAGLYNCVGKVLTFDNQTFVRQGRLILSDTGT